MKHNYSRLGWKQRWVSFVFCILLTLILEIIAWIAYGKGLPLWATVCIAAAGGCSMLFAVYLFLLNVKRKRIQKEFIRELDKEIRKKEHHCPQCGAMLGAGTLCPKCGYRIH